MRPLPRSSRPHQQHQLHQLLTCLPSRQYDEEDEKQVVSLENSNPFEGTYKKLCFSPDGKTLLGGLLVGDTKDYTKLLQLSKKDPEYVVPDVDFQLAVKANKIKDEAPPPPPPPPLKKPQQE